MKILTNKLNYYQLISKLFINMSSSNTYKAEKTKKKIKLFSKFRSPSTIDFSNEYLITSLSNSKNNSNILITNNSQSLIKNYKREPKKILLTDIFSLSSSRNNNNSPQRSDYLKTRKRHLHSNNLSHFSNKYKIINNNNSNENNSSKIVNNQINISQSIQSKKKRKNSKTLKLERFMKEKLYLDINKKIINSYNKREINVQKRLLDKFVHIKQVMTFWKGVFDFAHPLISIEKYKSNSNSIRRKTKQNQNFEDNKINNQKLNHFPRIYSNNKLWDKRHNEKLKEENLFYKKLIEEKKEINSIY